MDPGDSSADDTLRTARTIWAGMLTAIPMYAVILLLVTRGDGAGEVVPQLQTTLHLLAVVSGIIAWQVHRRLTRSASAPLDQRALYNLLSWVFSESIAIYGFVLGLLRRSLDDAAILMVVGVLAMLATRPRPELYQPSR
jgi:hypothetical protein